MMLLNNTIVLVYCNIFPCIRYWRLILSYFLIGYVVYCMRAILQLRTTTLVPVFSTIFQLAVTVVVPLAVGQLIRFLTNFEASSYPIGILGQIALLFIIFITFCQAFLNQDMQMNAHDILTTVLLGEFIFITHHWIFYIL